MTKNPKRITSKKTLQEALNMMEDNAITVLPVVDERAVPVGMIHLHDLVQIGLSVRSAGERKPAGARMKKAKKKQQP